MATNSSNLLLCNNIKIFLISWWIFLLFAVIFWYRNISVDRIWAPYFIILAILMILQYGYLAGGSSSQAGKYIYLCIWLSLLVLSISTFVITRNTFALFLLFCTSIIFLVALINFCVDDSLHVEGYQWHIHFEDWIWLYLSIMLLLIFSICITYGWSPVMILFAVYLIASILVIYFFYRRESRYSVYTYWFLWLTGLPFILWLLGLIYV